MTPGRPGSRGPRRTGPRRIRGRALAELLGGLVGDATPEAIAHILAATDLAATDEEVTRAIRRLQGARRGRGARRRRRDPAVTPETWDSTTPPKRPPAPLPDVDRL